MTEIQEKHLKAQELLETVEKYISIETPEKAVASMTDAQMLDFLSTYYLSENLNYDEEINKRTEETLLALEKELENGTKPPFSQLMVESLLSLCKLSVMDEIVDKVNSQNESLQGKLKGYDIMSPQVAMIYQNTIAVLMQGYMGSLAKEIDNECQSRGIDGEAFMKQAFTILTTDMSALFEIDSFAGLKNYEKVKHENVDSEKVIEFSKQTIVYTKMLLDQKVPEQIIVIYPSLMNHFLFNKFNVDTYQILGKIISLLKLEDKSAHMALFRQILEEIWYVENGRMLIFAIFQQQMEMMDQMMKSGMDPSQMMGGMDPNQMQGYDQNQMQGFDPSMMQGFDPAMMQDMMKNMDPAMMQNMMQGMDPAMLQGVDPAMVQNMMQNMDPAMMQGMMQGMAHGSQMQNNMPDANKLKELQEALMNKDYEKMEAMMPPEIKEMLEKMKKQQGPQ